MQWYHKDAVVSNNAELVITSVTLNHQGLYTCLANNEAGYTTSVVWVVVLGKTFNHYRKNFM